jgi:hypothetical protein
METKMSNEKMTPGSWVMSNGVGPLAKVTTAVLDGEVIAENVTWPNARAIAAVPELIEALREAIDYVEPKVPAARTNYGPNGRIVHAHLTEMAARWKRALEKAGAL